MSMTRTMPVHPAVEEWLGLPLSRCDICSALTFDLETQRGWSYALGEAMDVSLCAQCRGEDA